MILAAISRLGQMIFVMFGISVLVFMIFFATPGADPAARMAGRNATPETLAQIRHEYGFDRPLPVQYAIMIKRLFISRDITSYANQGEQIIPELYDATPVTLSLIFGAAILWIIAAIAAGVTAARHQGKFIDRALMIAGLIGISMPVFWLGEIANLITQSSFHHLWIFAWVPPLGYVPLHESPWRWCKTLVIPWLVLATLFAGIYSRVLRASLLDMYQEDFVRTARAKGLSENRILWRHVFRASLIGFVSLFGLDFGALAGGGALLTEVVFGLPGIGKMTFEALRTLDLPVIMVTVMYSSFFVVAASTAADLAYAALDPRIRHPRGG
jgi:peptide/nickel transport system permease protein